MEPHRGRDHDDVVARGEDHGAEHGLVAVPPLSHGQRRPLVGPFVGGAAAVRRGRGVSGGVDRHAGDAGQLGRAARGRGVDLDGPRPEDVHGAPALPRHALGSRLLVVRDRHRRLPELREREGRSYAGRPHAAELGACANGRRGRRGLAQDGPHGVALLRRRAVGGGRPRHRRGPPRLRRAFGAALRRQPRAHLHLARRLLGRSRQRAARAGGGQHVRREHPH
mmetsp:Transcript_93682/g.262071  ORF Transcript_93682/g.262071 Transcript_93682/m.262071 type:complete len:223 (-) Transcript_93682:461-1129(-)